MIDFKTLYETYVTGVYRFAFWLAGNSTEAEDITSETFIRVWTRKDDIRTETLKAYLFAIARNVYLERQRKNRNQVVLEETYPDPAPGPDRLVESQLELLRVQTLLRALPEIDRTAFILRVRHELPYAEIARILGISLTAAKVKVHRVRKKLLIDRIEREVT
ncbi:MAG: RNA polymerase sigma factor [bacterium]|nr:MAG: RNA polymerase sigma factor [bacterium]